MGFWDAYQEGANAAQQLNNNLYRAPLEDQALQQQNSLRQLALQKNQMDTQEAARQLAVAAGARRAAASAQPTPAVTTTTTDGGFSPAPQTGTGSSVRALLGDPVAAAQRDISDAEKTAAQYPGIAKLSGLNDRISQMKGDAPSPATYTPDPNPPADPISSLVAQKTAEDAQPTVTTTTTPGAPANTLKAQYDYYTSIGETEKAQALLGSVVDHANKVMALTGNPGDALKIVNDATGGKLAYSPLASLDAITNDGQLVGYIDKNKYKELVTGGAQPMDAMKGAMIPLELGGGGKKVLEFMAAHPNATADEIAAAGAEAGVPLSKMVPLLNETVKAQAQVKADERQEKQFRHADESQARMFAHTDAAQARTLAAVAERLNQDRSTPEDRETVAKMLASGEMDVKDVGRSKDRVALLARAKQINPNFDPRLTSAQNKSLDNLVKITGVLKSNEIEANKNFDQLTALYKKLGNGTIPAINGALNAINSGLGAPDPGTAAGVAYEAMTQYARVVNKQTGGGAITDTARKEANALLNVLKLNPKQFESKVAQYRMTMKNAMESQNEAIRSVRGTEAAPTPAPAGQTIAPKGTKVPKKGGGFYTSDGKGGWH